MPIYKPYHKLYYKGKPQGRAYVGERVKAKSKAKAIIVVKRANTRWSKTAGKNYSLKVVKVIKVRKKPKKRGFGLSGDFF